jgi:DNA-binding NarL/FixJ family response regulator
MRIAPAIALSDEARLRLEKLARGRSTPVRVAQRSHIVLLAGDGLQNKQIAEQMEVAPRWRGTPPFPAASLPNSIHRG